MKLFKTCDVHTAKKLANRYTLLIHLASSLRNVLKSSKTVCDIMCV